MHASLIVLKTIAKLSLPRNTFSSWAKSFWITGRCVKAARRNLFGFETALEKQWGSLRYLRLYKQLILWLLLGCRSSLGSVDSNCKTRKYFMILLGYTGCFQQTALLTLWSSSWGYNRRLPDENSVTLLDIMDFLAVEVNREIQKLMVWKWETFFPTYIKNRERLTDIFHSLILNCFSKCINFNQLADSVFVKWFTVI